MLAIVEGIPEEYENIKMIMDRLNLNIRKLNYVFTMDVKLMLIVLVIVVNRDASSAIILVTSGGVATWILSDLFRFWDPCLSPFSYHL